jgi:branched-chain amino acid transport system permease protein
MLVSMNPAVLRQIAYRLPLLEGGAALGLGGAIAAGIGAGLVILPRMLGRALAAALGGVVFAGLLRELLSNMLNGLAGTDDWAFNYDGLLPLGAIAAAVLGALACVQPGRAGYLRLPGVMRSGVTLVLLALLLALPALTNDFVAQVMMMVCLYILMGMGLNIELGLAGLVDLGFVAFFAVGAYTVALVTASGGVSLLQLNFFAALPLAVAVSAISGFVFGLPVLKVRGDYLAIATLGLGEIIRVLILSDMMKPLLGGAQGIVNVPKPELFGFILGTPTRLFYLTAVMAALAGYCAWRLQHSGLGRRWLAVREDEDVAQALGINLVQVKLSAYTMGAAFAGLAGGIFAGMVGSVFPQGFQLLISINVLAILVVGGIGSLPGVVIGAATLIGAPEVLRDLGEYRYLIYGLVIIAVVRLKPDGLLPAAVRHREVA